MQLIIPDIAPSTMKARRPDGSWYTSPAAEAWDALVKKVVGEQRLPNWDWCAVVVTIETKSERNKLSCRVKQTLDALTRAGFWKNDACVSSIVLKYGAIGRNRTTILFKKASYKWTARKRKATRAEWLEEARAIISKKRTTTCAALASKLGCSLGTARSVANQLKSEGVEWDPKAIDDSKIEAAREILRKNPGLAITQLAKRLMVSYIIALRIVGIVREQGLDVMPKRERAKLMIEANPDISANELIEKLNATAAQAYYWRKRYGNA